MRVVESGAFKKTPQSRAEIIGQLIIARVQSALRGQFDFVRSYERPACDCRDYSQRTFHRGRDGPRTSASNGRPHVSSVEDSGRSLSPGSYLRKCAHRRLGSYGIATFGRFGDRHYSTVAIELLVDLKLWQRETLANLPITLTLDARFPAVDRCKPQAARPASTAPKCDLPPCASDRHLPQLRSMSPGFPRGRRH
jgi:hypothetical protein